MKSRLVVAMIVVLAVMAKYEPAFAYSTLVEKGVGWLVAAQNADGEWGADSLAVLDTSAVLEAFAYLGFTGSAYSRGVAWLRIQDTVLTDFLARKISTLLAVGENISGEVATLIYSRGWNVGWGGDADSINTVIDTALALQALGAVNYSDQSVISGALSYLLSIQNADGGWGFYQGDASSVYMTEAVTFPASVSPLTRFLVNGIDLPSPLSQASWILHHG